MVPIKTFKNVLPNELIIPDMQKVTATRPLVAKMISDCGRIKAGIQLKMWKNLIFYDLFNEVANQSVFLKIKDVTNHALVRKFLKTQIKTFKIECLML